MIKNIIFDLSEVIISGYHNVEFVVAEHTDIKAEEFLERKKETIDMFLDAMRGKYTEDEYLEDLINGMNWKMSKEELKKYIRENLNIPVLGTIEVVKKLKANYNVILLSDHILEWVDYILENNRDIDIFDKKYFSYEYGKLKVDEGIFEYILKDADINADETIFIDDSRENIENAKQSGITGIVFEDVSQLQKELTKLNIKL